MNAHHSHCLTYLFISLSLSLPLSIIHTQTHTHTHTNMPGRTSKAIQKMIFSFSLLLSSLEWSDLIVYES